MTQRFGSSRRTIVRLLRRARHTVNELARALGVTDNAVRANLERLEQEGLVRQVGTRPSFRKPESVYDLTPEAERLFSKAYAPVLAGVLAAMEAELDETALDALLAGAGRRLAAPYLPALAGLSPRERAERTLKILEDLGGVAELDERDGRLEVRGFGCPFSQVVAQHPKVCVMATALVGELLGCDVREVCQRNGDRPRCCFRTE
jgi:predicted ArsR family transcriptional regulator